ncbi:hypothetical protein M5K25_003446 [Dendrobium thyrsiflorum]|uniref:Uncharacterized protein n=1 Tax=Dendrobium thyrsiflorum TaxID=117978 RepID=A0ABD0VQL7_DENTH
MKEEGLRSARSSVRAGRHGGRREEAVSSVEVRRILGRLQGRRIRIEGLSRELTGSGCGRSVDWLVSSVLNRGQSTLSL